MAKSGTGDLIGNLMLLAVIAVVAYLFIAWLKNSAAQKKASSSGVSAGSAGSSGSGAVAAGIGSAAFNAWTNLVKAVTQGQTLANLTLGTSSPANNNLIPYLTPSSNPIDLNQFAQPLNIGGSLYDLGGGLSSLGSLSTSDPGSSALLQTQPLQSFNMSGIGFPLS